MHSEHLRVAILRDGDVIEWYRFAQQIDDGHNLRRVLPCGTALEGERAVDEVILYIDHEQSAHGLDDRLAPRAASGRKEGSLMHPHILRSCLSMSGEEYQ